MSWRLACAVRLGNFSGCARFERPPVRSANRSRAFCWTGDWLPRNTVLCSSRLSTIAMSQRKDSAGLRRADEVASGRPRGFATPRAALPDVAATHCGSCANLVLKLDRIEFHFCGIAFSRNRAPESPTPGSASARKSFLCFRCLPSLRSAKIARQSEHADQAEQRQWSWPLRQCGAEDQSPLRQYRRWP